jgi:hypothetical protein
MGFYNNKSTLARYIFLIYYLLLFSHLLFVRSFLGMHRHTNYVVILPSSFTGVHLYCGYNCELRIISGVKILSEPNSNS